MSPQFGHFSAQAIHSLILQAQPHYQVFIVSQFQNHYSLTI